MRAPQSTQAMTSPARKAPRRSSSQWRDERPIPGRSLKVRAEGAAILPFPGATGGENLETRVQRVNKRWTLSEREYRRLQALRKQEELWLILAGEDLESELRAAVADGEQPVLLPELEGLGA